MAEKILIFGGKTGWIGKELVLVGKKLGHDVICAASRLENREQVEAEILTINPNVIINAAGITGKPSVDWCEDHRQETIRTNVLGVINLVDIAWLHDIHVTNISTGCIYEYDELHPMHSGKGFSENDEPNFIGSFYSRTKIIMEKLLLEYPNTLNLRIKMPVSSNIFCGFIGKIIKYKKIVNIPNSVTVLDDLLPFVLDMTIKRIKGNYNFVNPGTIAHKDILDFYIDLIDKNHSYEVISIEEHDKILKARRANAELNSEKLLTLYPSIPNAIDSVKAIFKRAAQH